MDLDSLLAPWSGHAFRHLPEASPYGPLDFRFAGRSAENRWNVAGQPTLYLAGSPGAAAAEWARHLEGARGAGLATKARRRTVFQLDIRLDRVLDLCDSQVWDAISLPRAPECFLDKVVAQATANYLRAVTAAHALRAPSVAFLDRLDHWNLVLFLERFPADSSAFITGVKEEAPLRWGR